MEIILSGGCAFGLKPTRGSSHHPGVASHLIVACIQNHRLTSSMGIWEREVLIVNLYDPAISCLASTLPNHDGHLAGLGTSSAPAGILLSLFCIL